MELSDIFIVWSARILDVKFEFLCTTKHLGDWDGLIQPWNIILLHNMKIMIVKLQLCYVMSYHDYECTYWYWSWYYISWYEIDIDTEVFESV